MSMIYHITRQKEWELAKIKGYYQATSLQTEGFIHCSEESQVPGVLQRYYRGMKDLVKLQIDTERLIHPLRYETAPALNEKFPHIYGHLNMDAVVAVESIQG